MWGIETLDASRHDRSRFDCGVDEMNDWLQRVANQAAKKGNSLTRVLVDGEDPRILGYYSQTAYQLVGEELALAFSGRQRYPVPCVLLARLARCLSVRGQGVGELLMVHALRSCVRVSEEIGIEFVVVHALDENAARFYEGFGFERFADHPSHLLIPLKTIRKAFAV